MDFAKQMWTENFGGGEYLDPGIAVADLAAIQTASATVKRYVDKHVAHSDSRPVPAENLPTVDDLHGVIEQIGTVYKKYVYLLKATEFVLTPFVQYDWKAVFRVPWIRAPS